MMHEIDIYGNVGEIYIQKQFTLDELSERNLALSRWIDAALSTEIHNRMRTFFLKCTISFISNAFTLTSCNFQLVKFNCKEGKHSSTNLIVRWRWRGAFQEIKYSVFWMYACTGFCITTIPIHYTPINEFLLSTFFVSGIYFLFLCTVFLKLKTSSFLNCILIWLNINLWSI